MGKKAEEFDYDATRSLRVCLLAKAAMAGYETGPEGEGERAPKFLETYFSNVDAAKDLNNNPLIDYDWMKQTRSKGLELDYDKAWQEWMGARRDCRDKHNERWKAETTKIGVGAGDIKSGKQMSDMIAKVHEGWLLTKCLGLLAKRVATRKREGKPLYPGVKKTRRTTHSARSPSPSEDAPEDVSTPGPEGAAAEGDATPTVSTPLIPAAEKLREEALEALMTEHEDSYPEEWACWLENGPPNLSASAQQVAHFHIPLVDPKEKRPTRNKLKGTSRKAVTLSELKAKGYEKPAAYLKIKATRELGDSLEIANAVAA